MTGERKATQSSLVSATGEPLSVLSPQADDQATQIAALKSELEALRDAVANVASTARTLAGTSVNDALSDTEDLLKRNVFASVGIAALIGYLWGRTR